MRFQTMRIYVIIVNYNKYIETIRAVESVLVSNVSDKYDLNILLIDNSESEDYFNYLSAYFFNKPRIFVLKNPKNLGFAKAVNIGINIALKDGFDYILLLNNDAYLDENCLSKLIDFANQINEIGLLSPTIFYALDPNRVWSSGGYFDMFLSRIKMLLKNKIVSKEELCKTAPQFVDFISGCVMLIKKEIIERVGLLDDRFFLYNEDLDYCLRVKSQGFKIAYVPSAFAFHEISVVKDRTNYFTMYHLAKSSVMLRKKHFSKLYYYYYLILHFFLFTPFRFFQIFKGSRSFKSVLFWLKGSLDGIRFKI